MLGQHCEKAEKKAGEKADCEGRARRGERKGEVGECLGQGKKDRTGGGGGC